MARTAPARAASHESVRTMNGGMSAGRFGGAQVGGAARANGQVANSGVHGNMKTSGQFENRPGNAQANSGANSGVTARQRELSQNRPPSAMPNGNRSTNGPAGNSNLARAGNGRAWEAQGNATDRGRAPQGFGDSNRPANAPPRNSPRSMGDRPTPGGSNSGGTSPHTHVMSDRPPWAGNGGAHSSNGLPSGSGGRSYEPSQRSNRAPSYDNRGYAQQPSYSPRSYSSPRTYSAPSRSYPAPSRSYSPPASRSYGGGGYSAPRSYGGGGGSPRSYGGGGAARSYGGGGGGHVSSGGGGGHSSGGGGGHASSGGGGSHGGGGGHPHR